MSFAIGSTYKTNSIDGYKAFPLIDNDPTFIKDLIYYAEYSEGKFTSNSSCINEYRSLTFAYTFKVN